VTGSRRTRALFLDAAASIEAASRVAEILAEELEHDASWERQQVQEFTTLAQGYQLNEQAQQALVLNPS
jgi:glycerol-3-phosphate dehydrogenase